LWVRRVEARTKRRSRASSCAKQAPKIAARIEGPLPADRTPLDPGENPSHSLTSALAVPHPRLTGSASDQPRSRHANERANRSGSSPEASRAWATMHVCSVSSLTMPRPNSSRWRR
jgi:hypothetical protein